MDEKCPQSLKEKGRTESDGRKKSGKAAEKAKCFWHKVKKLKLLFIDGKI